VPWNKVVEFADPLACQAALQTTVQAEILPTTRGSFYAEATQIGMSALRLQRFKVALPQIGTFTIAPDRGRHGALVAKFEDFLAAHPNQPLYLTEICAGIDVAERTLRVACEEHLGMGPIRFLTLRRMHLVRRALLGADATRTSVTSIVTDHGFWELGRFSVAYRVLFGETPSETLRRPAEQPRIPLNRPSSLSTNSISGYRN
jgi:AraC-like DNA-binding protein